MCDRKKWLESRIEQPAWMHNTSDTKRKSFDTSDYIEKLFSIRAVKSIWAEIAFAHTHIQQANKRSIWIRNPENPTKNNTVFDCLSSFVLTLILAWQPLLPLSTLYFSSSPFDFGSLLRILKKLLLCSGSRAWFISIKTTTTMRATTISNTSIWHELAVARAQCIWNLLNLNLNGLRLVGCVKWPVVETT